MLDEERFHGTDLPNISRLLSIFLHEMAFSMPKPYRETAPLI